MYKKICPTKPAGRTTETINLLEIRFRKFIQLVLYGGPVGLQKLVSFTELARSVRLPVCIGMRASINPDKGRHGVLRFKIYFNSVMIIKNYYYHFAVNFIDVCRNGASMFIGSGADHLHRDVEGQHWSIQHMQANTAFE